MISNRDELKTVLKHEKKLYLNNSLRGIKLLLIADQDYFVWKFMKCLRYMEYHQNNNHTLRSAYWERKKNLLGAKLGLFIFPNCVDKGLRIWHYGDIIIHRNSIIGENCQLHGMNCIGNKGIADSGVPVIGNNVNIGVGAKIIGDIYIADNVCIGANAVVTESCHVEGATLIGVPAKMIKKGNDDEII